MIANAQDRAAAALTSLTDALAALDRVAPVEPREHDLGAALGHTLAEDARAETTLRLAGARLRRIDIALLASHGIARVATRTPRVLVMHAASVAPVATLIASAIETEGAIATREKSPGSNALQIACEDAKIDAVALLGDDDRRDDESLRTLASIGRIEFDGVALSPGGAIAFGYVDPLPVLLLPGRMDAALAAWLAVGRRLLARLSFRLIEDQPFLLELARPIASTRGTAEVVPVRRRAAQVEPLTGNAWSAQSIARADGWILVPAEIENLPAGTKVQMRPWP